MQFNNVDRILYGPYLTLSRFVGLYTKSCFGHRFFDNSNRVRGLCSRIYTLLSDYRGNFLPHGRKIMIALLFADLHLALLEYLPSDLDLQRVGMLIDPPL